MSTWEIAVLFMAGYLAVFSLVNRICICIERCNMATSYASTFTNSQENNVSDVKEENN